MSTPTEWLPVLKHPIYINIIRQYMNGPIATRIKCVKYIVMTPILVVLINDLNFERLDQKLVS